MSSSPLVRAAFGLLVVATIAAFFVTQRLKADEPVVLRFAAQPARISPNGDRVKDASRVGFDLSEPADVTFSITNEKGEEVRRIVEDRPLAGDERHRFRWNGRNDDGRVVPDGLYRMQVSLRDRGRTLDSYKRLMVDTRPPRPRLSGTSPNVISTGRGVPQFVEIGYRGPRNACPEFRIFRTDSGPPRLVLRFRGNARRQAVWNGFLRTEESATGAAACRVGGGPSDDFAPEGNYAFTVRVRDRAGNAGVSGPDVPTARSAPGGTGVAVRRLTLRGPLVPVRVGELVRLEVGPRRRHFRFALARVGSGRVLRSGDRRGRSFRVRIPPDARSGLHVLRVVAGRDRSATPVVVNGDPPVRRRPTGRVLVVVPAITWQGLNEEDDDLDGFGDTLASSRGVRIERPFLGGLPSALARETAPLLRFLDADRLNYEITTDLALARREGPELEDFDGVAFAGSARWLTDRLDLRLRDFVEQGGRLVSFGTDAFRRRVAVAAGRLVDPSPSEHRNLFGEVVRPGRVDEEAPMSVVDDELGLFEGTDGLMGLFTTFEESAERLGGTELVASAGRDADREAFVAYRLGDGLVIRVGTPEWAGALGGADADAEVAEVTRNIWRVLKR